MGSCPLFASYVEASHLSDFHVIVQKASRSVDHVIMAHDHRLIMAVDQYSPNRTFHDFRSLLLIKTDVLPFVYQILIDS